MVRLHEVLRLGLLAVTAVACTVPGRRAHVDVPPPGLVADEPEPQPVASRRVPALAVVAEGPFVAPPVEAPVEVEVEVAAAAVAAPSPAPVLYVVEPAAAARTLELVVGQELVFENRDRICHGFFSSSAPNAFSVGVLQPQGRASVRFSHPGTVQVYCSLHEHRQLTIHVVPQAAPAR